GKVLHGLVDWEDQVSVRFRQVIQNPGKPTSVFHTVIAKAEIKENGIELLEAKDRELLKTRIDALDRDVQRRRIEKLVLAPARSGDNAQGAMSYTGKHFVLLSNATEAIVRRVADRLDQIYTAYNRYLPPRQTAAQSTKIYLY